MVINNLASHGNISGAPDRTEAYKSGKPRRLQC